MWIGTPTCANARSRSSAMTVPPAKLWVCSTHSRLVRGS
jgi:hypothetical protein